MPPIVLDGTTGITTPGLTNTGTETLVNLTTTGNTTLGDATTDTLTVGVTGIVKDASGNVGIGTASVATNFRTQFVGTAGSNTSAASSGTTQAASAVLRLQAGGGFTGTLDIGQGGGTGSWLQSCDTTNLATTYSLLLNPVGGNVGIGTSSPNATLHLGAGGATFRIGITASNQYGELYRDGATGNIVLNAAQASFGNLVFQTTSTERMRIDTSGNLLVGTTSAFSQYTSKIEAYSPSGSVTPISTKANDTSSRYQIEFYNPNGRVGVISTSGSATTYATSSDYRLKNTVEPMVNALTRVAALKPVTYKWNVDGSDGEGFIAHELQAIVPDCVTGEKDAVDADGNPVYQGIDTSFLVATLTAAIQEMKAIIDTQVSTITQLTNRITALESK